MESFFTAYPSESYKRCRAPCGTTWISSIDLVVPRRIAEHLEHILFNLAIEAAHGKGRLNRSLEGIARRRNNRQPDLGISAASFILTSHSMLSEPQCSAYLTS